MKSLLSLFLVAVLAVPALAIPPGFRITPFRPNVGPVPRGVPARNFAPRNFNNFHHGANFNFQRNFGFNGGYNYSGVVAARNFGIGYTGYGVPAVAAFVPSYGYAQAAPVYAPQFAPGGCGQYFPQQQLQAPVYSYVPQQAPVYAYTPQFAPAYNAGGCGQYFPAAAFGYGY